MALAPLPAIHAALAAQIQAKPAPNPATTTNVQEGAAQALHDLGLVPQAPATAATTPGTHRDENTVDPSA